LLIPLLFLLHLTGCATYEYNIVEPPDLQAHIGRNTDHIVKRGPLEYHLRSYDNRLVMRIYNDTDDPISLLGDRSFVVSENGQSHPLRSQTIAPRSYIKMILPPPKPQFYSPGPTFGVGFGTTVGRYNHPHYHYNAPYSDPGPQYFTVFDEEQTIYWDWKGETDVSMTLLFQRNTDQLKHQFTFHRKKM
jgi:hypothetical protein